MTPPLRCAILSAAHVHTAVYAAALRDLDETALLAVWDDDPVRGAAFAAAHGAEFVGDLDALLARPDLDAVLITAENARHAALTLAACRAGKHVLCEKPLATNVADAEAMIAATREAGVILATAFPMRHNAPALQARETLRAGALGRVLAVRATNHSQVPPGWFTDPAPAGGGAAMDHTVHVADLLRWYLDEDPSEVYAEMSHGLRHMAVEDVAFLTIAFPSGVVATLDASWSRPQSWPMWGDLTMEIACEGGTLALNGFAQNLTHYPDADRRALWLDYGTNADAALIRDFARAVREGGRPAADGRDGERALAVALAAYESARSGEPAPVRAPNP